MTFQPNALNRRSESPAISVLMYHQVGLFCRPKAHRASFCHIRRFRLQMAYLKVAGYRVVSLGEAFRALFCGIELPGRSVVLTFDDGCDNFREFALPVLREHGYPSTMFLVANMLGRTTEWMTDMPFQSRLMSGEVIREIGDVGDVTFGSHSMNHVRLAECDLKTAKAEVFESKDRLENLLGREVPDFCYPYGSYNEAVRNLVEEAGYKTGLTCNRGGAACSPNAYEITRKAISHGDSLVGYAWKLLKNN
jgi:peptidoglycan/xylan/chitin deacetylase (PgdA/CDA1 family)